MSDRKSYEKKGWQNGLLGQAYDLITEAQYEYHEEQDIFLDLKKILGAIEDADISLEGDGA